MQVNVAELLESSDLKEPVYPGKKYVKKYVIPGQFKSHCVIFDWRSEDLRLEVKAGSSGRNLDFKDLKNYPVCFQARTYLDIEFDNDNEDEDETASGKGGGGGKKPAKKKGLDGVESSISAFGEAMDGALPDEGKIKKFVVMGKELAKEAFAKAFENLKTQLSQTKIMVMDLMKDVGNVIQRATPGGGLDAKGNENIKYKYDSERNGPMFGAVGPS